MKRQESLLGQKLSKTFVLSPEFFTDVLIPKLVNITSEYKRNAAEWLVRILRRDYAESPDKSRVVSGSL